MSDIAADISPLTTKRGQPILGTLSVSLIVHAVVIALLGGIVVFKVLERPPAQFKPPPPPAKRPNWIPGRFVTRSRFASNSKTVAVRGSLPA